MQRYNREFLKAIQKEYPLSESVRDGLKCFQESLGLTDEDAEWLNNQFSLRTEAEYYQYYQKQQQSTPTPPSKPATETDVLSSERGVDYTKLRDLLAQGKWKEADKETLLVMLKVGGREKDDWLRAEDIEKFPCTDLRTIDTLWVKYSKGRFGSSVQKRIWESVGGTPDADYETYCRFGDRVKWRVDNNWLYYSDLTFTTEAPEGHLPWRSQVWGSMYSESSRVCWWWGVSSLASRLVNCNI